MKGGVKKGSHPEGSPGPTRSTPSLGLCVRRVQGEECLPGYVPAGQGVGPGFLSAPESEGCQGSSSNQEFTSPRLTAAAENTLFHLKLPSPGPAPRMALKAAPRAQGSVP